MCKGSQSSDKVQVANVIREALSPDLCHGRHCRGSPQVAQPGPSLLSGDSALWVVVNPFLAWLWW